MQVASTQKVPRHSLHTRHSGQAHSTPPSFRPRDFLENPAVAGICGIFYGKCPTLFIYFVAYFLENYHVDTCPLCALLHVLPTPEASPVKLSRTSRLQENRRQITDHRKLLIGDKWRAAFCFLFCFHANARAPTLFTTRDCCIFSRLRLKKLRSGLLYMTFGISLYKVPQIPATSPRSARLRPE